VRVPLAGVGHGAALDVTHDGSLDERRAVGLGEPSECRSAPECRSVHPSAGGPDGGSRRTRITSALGDRECTDSALGTAVASGPGSHCQCIPRVTHRRCRDRTFLSERSERGRAGGSGRDGLRLADANSDAATEDGAPVVEPGRQYGRSYAV
jgi:hypothetical protein